MLQKLIINNPTNMYLNYQEDYLRRKAMIAKQLELGKIEEFDEGMQWDKPHDHKEACRCLAEKGEPMYV